MHLGKVLFMIICISVLTTIIVLVLEFKGRHFYVEDISREKAKKEENSEGYSSLGCLKLWSNPNLDFLAREM